MKRIGVDMCRPDTEAEEGVINSDLVAESVTKPEFLTPEEREPEP